MRICCGLTNHLELARRPDLYASPVVVGHWEEHVIGVSEEALPFGVVTGMALRQAEHLCPQATFLPPEPEAAEQLRERISSALYDLAPTVEVHLEGILLAWLRPGERNQVAVVFRLGRNRVVGFPPGKTINRGKPLLFLQQFVNESAILI